MIDTLRACEATEGYGILDRDRSLWGKKILDVPVLGGDELLPELASRGATHFIVGLGGVGDNKPRRRLYESGLKHGLTPLTIRHPAATCSPSATVGGGSAILPAAVINACAVLGANTIVNTGAIVEHDCVMEDHVHVATGSRLSSTVRVGAMAHIGAGATVRQSITIGEGAIVGAGAVVVRDVEPWTVVVGVPARVLERLSPDAPNSLPHRER